MSMESQHYNQIYSENEKTFGDGKPEKVVEDILAYCSEGNVLELGAGQGRNSLFLAQKGFNVISPDLSEVGVEQINKKSIEEGLSLKAIVGDARTVDFEKSFDVIVSTYMLHHLKNEEARKVIQKIQMATVKGGLNALAVFTKDGDFYNFFPKKRENFYPEKDELKKLYEGWEIVEYKEEQSRAIRKHEDGTPMMNIAARLLARKL